MASPTSYSARLGASRPTVGPTPGPVTSVSKDAGVAGADRIPIYVGGILILSALSLVGLHKLKFRMIVGAG